MDRDHSRSRQRWQDAFAVASWIGFMANMGVSLYTRPIILSGAAREPEVFRRVWLLITVTMPLGWAAIGMWGWMLIDCVRQLGDRRDRRFRWWLIGIVVAFPVAWVYYLMEWRSRARSQTPVPAPQPAASGLLPRSPSRTGARRREDAFVVLVIIVSVIAVVSVLLALLVINFPGPAVPFVAFGAAWILGAGLGIWMLVDCVERLRRNEERRGDLIAWLVGLVLGSTLAAVLYYYIERRPRVLRGEAG